MFDTAETGTRFHIHGQDFIHGGPVSEFRLPFDGYPISDAFPSLIAFHFLALAMGEQVYDERLDELREAIRDGRSWSDWHIAESGIDRELGYQPWHLVGLAQCEPHVVVRVQLFGWSVWRVHFPKIASLTAPFGLRLNLQSESIEFAAPQVARPIDVPVVPTD